MIVHVYRNLRYGRSSPLLYSIAHKGRVILRLHRVLLTNAKFVVREGGRQRVLREKRKNVHAFVVGELQKRGCLDKDLRVRVIYNPYVSGAFHSRQIPKLNGAGRVLLNENGISACRVF